MFNSLITWLVRVVAAGSAYLLITGSSRENLLMMTAEGVMIFIWGQMEYSFYKESKKR
jgi:hypothetical protein